MAHVTKLFMGFEESKVSPTGITSGTNWAEWAKPPRVYHRSATSSLSTTSTGTYAYGANWTSSGRGLSTVHTSSQRFMIGGNGTETGAGRTSYIASTGGIGIGVERDYWMGVDASEGYFQFDIRFFGNWGTTPYVTVTPRTETNITYTDPVAIFKWGDVSIFAKSVYWNNAGPNTIILTLSIRNNGVEVATILLPEQAEANFFYLKIYVKLDAAAGEILVTANASTMSVAYSGANTVTTTSVANADFIYFGPPAIDNGTVVQQGYFDNVWLGSTGFPAGRPTGYLKFVSADGTLSSWAAEGTGATTVTNALSAAGDAKAARGSGSGATALLTLATLDTTGLESTLIGYTLVPIYVSNRDQTTEKRLSIGMSSGGTHTMGALAAAIQPPLAYNSVPPAEVYTPYIWEGLYIDSAAVAFPSASLHSVRLLTV